MVRVTRVCSHGITQPLFAAGFAAVVAACAWGCAGTRSDPAAMDHTIVQEIEAWRATHEADYRRDWATIEGLHFLEPGASMAGSAPSNEVVLTKAVPPVIGRFVLENERVTFEPAFDVPIMINGSPAGGPTVLRDDGQSPTDELVVNGVRIVIHKSGARQSIRVRDPNGERARGFLGFTWFPIDATYRVAGRFIPDATPRAVRVLNTFGDEDAFTTEGVVEFRLQGQTLRLRPFTTRPKRLYFVFKDASSGRETYEAARFLYADLQDDGAVILDFNQAYNPPCAFNPFTTCPIPLPENRLPLKVLAGEQAYPVHVELPRL